MTRTPKLWKRRKNRKTNLTRTQTLIWDAAKTKHS
jgi:hypothetical protein